MLRWPLPIISAFCAVVVYGQQSINPEISNQNRLYTPAINVTPLRVEMDSGEFFDQIQVGNDADEMLNVQLRIFAWSQANGTDQYAPSADIFISPSITRIAPRQIQTFRLVRSKDIKATGEARYRIIIDQLPNRTVATASQSQTRLQFSVPLFVGRDTAAPSKLEWKISGNQILIINNGGKTVKINDAFLVKHGGERIAIKGTGTRYVLGNSDVLWEINGGVDCTSAALKITALVDQQTIDAIPSTNCP